jgi:adenylylsulfate kinase
MSWAIWITGIPGSGKSAIASAAEDRLRAQGDRVRRLELDEIRKTLTPHPQYTDAERDVVYRALVYLAAVLTEAETPVLIDATAHRRAWRELARRTIPRFAEVQILCPPAVAQARERGRTGSHAPRGIYARAGQPGATVPGVDVPYEPAEDPELVIDSVAESVQTAAARVVELAGRLAAETTPAPADGGGWAIWITGPPGSGKTTLASRALSALRARQLRVRTLEVATARRFLLPDRPGSEADHDILHRAIAYAAKLLTEGGWGVIVDVTAPRRVWRELARELIPCFGEVQLACPGEVCLERERAARWRLGGGAVPRPWQPVSAPDVALDYEESVRPDLVLRTDVHDPWSNAEQVLYLVRRLHRTLSMSIETS